MRFVSLVLLLFPALASAQEDMYHWRFNQVQIENDAFWTFLYSLPDDRFYTNGLRLSANKGRFEPGANDDRLPRWLRPVRKRCAGCVIYPSFTLSQSVYTPEDIKNPEPQPGDHPWAAWLFAGFGAAIETSERARHEFEVQLGVTGDIAGGRFGQTLWHAIVNSPRPKGWDNQFGPDLGVNTSYSYQYIALRASGDSRINWDFVPNVKAATGTMVTYASVGATVRFGRNITGFPYSSIHTHDTRRSVARDQNFEIHGFVGVDFRAVAYNYFLEGSLFGHDPNTVDAKHFVKDFTFGMTARFRRYYLTYAVVHRSEEFVRTVGTDSGQEAFGSLTITVGLR